ncbi:MAG TPA: DUF1707 domain-containing protein [Solirubrobacteraceae bacterium]|nr:DUF1707 domain-containing protein [Solirubrobacteraceae bacterium]
MDVRASDAERDRAVEVLRDAAAEGRLTFEELADRIGIASEATTRGELERITADLPVPAAPAVAGPVDVSSWFGDVKRSGVWTVPERSRWRSAFGDVVLDLREAHVGASVVTIDAGTVFGDVDLLVPEGVAVEVHSRALLGDVRQKAGQAAPAGAPRIVLVGGTVFGDVRVRAKRLRERLAARLLGGR